MSLIVDSLLSSMLKGIADGLSETLEEHTGQRCAFVLMVAPSGNDASHVQYVSNVQRADASLMIATLLERWRQQLPDIPFHQRN